MQHSVQLRFSSKRRRAPRAALVLMANGHSQRLRPVRFETKSGKLFQAERSNGPFA
jgi:hypothetical protein